MNPDLHDYISRYCKSYFRKEEAQALKRAGATDAAIELYKKAALKSDHFAALFGFENEQTNNLVALGRTKLEELIVSRVYESNHPEILNLCAKCGKLARTPKAKQCRHCGYDWH